MIKGIGTDLVSLARIKQSLDRTPAIVKRILSDMEQTIFDDLLEQQKVAYLAKRFAAKEAFAKAVGTGVRNQVQLREIIVLNDKLGKPYFAFSDALEKWLNTQGIAKTHLSMSDTDKQALAFVIVE